MAFRKRNIAVGRTPPPSSPGEVLDDVLPGVRPSPLTSYPVTSTGTPSFDGLLGGHSGLALGSTLLIEESGTTDFAGALLRYYAAEGICQGHVVHVVGVGEGWVRELPGTVEEKGKDKLVQTHGEDEKMKIAWRYERLGQASERALPNRGAAPTASTPSPVMIPFCHTFDLTKRITLPTHAKINHIPISPSSTFEKICESLSKTIASSPAQSVHRLVVPSLLSPALWPPGASRPDNLLPFFRSINSISRQFQDRLTVMMTLPLELYPRTSGLVRWAEILSDGVLELTPFPHLMEASNSLAESGGARSSEEQPQGMVKFHKLPISTERGEAGAGAGNSIGEDLAFTVSRRKFTIKSFSLPPLEGDQDAQKEAGKLTSKDVEF